MKEILLKKIDSLYRQGDFQYILAKYIDRDYWFDTFNDKVDQIFIDNMTDFNYSTCFSYFIQSTLFPVFTIGNNKLTDYLKEGNESMGVMVLISVIAPYAVIKYSRYTYTNGAVQLHEAYSPLNHETKRIGESIQNILHNSGIQALDENILNVTVPDISLELKEENVTIFNCLFEGY